MMKVAQPHDIRIGEVYRHFSGQEVIVCCLCVHANTGESLVCLQYIDKDFNVSDSVIAVPRNTFFDDVSSMCKTQKTRYERKIYPKITPEIVKYLEDKLNESRKHKVQKH